MCDDTSTTGTSIFSIFIIMIEREKVGRAERKREREKERKLRFPPNVEYTGGSWRILS